MNAKRPLPSSPAPLAVLRAEIEAARTQARELEQDADVERYVALADLALRLLAVAEAAEPFASGGDWGTWKAYLVHGPETKEMGMNAARRITALQAAVDAALAALEGPR